MDSQLRLALEQVERAREAAKSKQPRLKNKKPDAHNFYSSVLKWVNDANLEEPEYRTDSRTRDTWLSQFWKKEPHLAGVISSINSIDTNRGWHMVGGRNQVSRYTQILRNAEDGAGWRQYISLQSTAYYTTDIGAITETGRDGKNGPLRALYHLDSTKCYLTGNRSAPLRYNKTKQPWTNDDFFRLTSMRNIMEEYNGLGFSATSRVLDMAKLMLAVYTHQMEMIGARAPKGLLLLQNISQGQWEEAMKVREARLDSDMRKYYNAVAVIAQEGVDSVDAKLVALSQLPEGFDIEVFTNLLMYAYALCIGYDPIEFWPVLAGQLGRGRETDIQHRKGTGKGGLNFMLSFQEQLQAQLPETIHFEFEQRDQEGVLLDAEVSQAWANVVTTLYSGKSSQVPGPRGEEGGDGLPVVNDAESVITREEARMLLAMNDVIPDAWTSSEEEAKSTDAEDIERMRKEELLEKESVRRAIYQYPHDPIVRYSWPRGRTEVLFSNGEEALKATRFTIVKPVALIPEFNSMESPEPKVISAPTTFPLKRVNGFNMYRGDCPPLTIVVKDKQGQEIDVSSSVEIIYCIYDQNNKLLVQKEIGRGVQVERSVISIEFAAEDTLSLLGIYRHSVKVMDDLGRTFTVYQGDMAVLEEYIDA